MLFQSSVALAGAALTLIPSAAAVPTKVEKRVAQTNSWDPANTITFGCTQLTIPQPGGPNQGGSGGTGIFNSGGMTLFAPDGSNVTATDCENAQSGCPGTCFRNCRISSPWLVQDITDGFTTFIPSGGICNMGFSYLGQSYSTSDGGACATNDNGFEPFSSTQTAVCFAEACAAGDGSCGVPPGGFAPGQCGIHVVQYQKPDPSVDPYTLDVNLKDAYGNDIGDATGAVTSVSVTGALPYTVDVGTGGVDDDPVTFAYGDQSWDSNSEQCSLGAYDSGSRQMDCSFSC